MSEHAKQGDVATKLMFENERVKVWEMDLAPGEASDWHTHTRDYLLCILEGESIDADLPDGGTLHLPVQPGQCVFIPAGNTEQAINRSDVRYWEILIELK